MLGFVEDTPVFGETVAIVVLVVFRAHVLNFFREFGAWLVGIGTEDEKFREISSPGSSAVVAGISPSREVEFLFSFMVGVFVAFVGEIVAGNFIFWAIMSFESKGKGSVVVVISSFGDSRVEHSEGDDTAK